MGGGGSPFLNLLMVNGYYSTIYFFIAIRIKKFGELAITFYCRYFSILTTHGIVVSIHVQKLNNYM